MRVHRSLMQIPYKLRPLHLRNYAESDQEFMNPCTGRVIKKTWLNGRRVYKELKAVTDQLRLEYGENGVAMDLKNRFQGMNVSEIDQFGRAIITECLPHNHSFVNNRLVKATRGNLALMRQQLSTQAATLRLFPILMAPD